MAEEAQTPEQDPGFIELREAYEGGELIVFVGSGVSTGAGLPSWGQLATLLTERARARRVEPEMLEEIQAIVAKERYIDAFTELEHALGPAEFGMAIERAIDDGNVAVPEAAHAIAALAPKLRAVLTTNLDHLLERAFAGRWPMFSRAQGDLATRRGYILKLHGTLLERETWVMTREQYDRAMYAAPRMATTFTALFHTCPILFVGFGPVDAEFEQLLARVRTLAGTQPPRHFALMTADLVTRSGRRRLEGAGVRVIPYLNADGTHGEVVRLLRALAEDCAAPAGKPAVSMKAPHNSDASPEDSLLAGIPPRWARYLRQFLASYLGTPEHPEVFCGRTAILEDLAAWQRARTPARRLLMAPGGRGKSALLVRFALKLVAEGVAVAWVPVSLRFGLHQSNAVWAALAARLAWLHGESSPPETPDGSQALDRIHDHLRRPLPDGRPRVVLLDGLDEAGWEVDATMLPARLAENTQLLVAVRGEGGEADEVRWQHRLGWERDGLGSRIALVPLDRNAVSEGIARFAPPLTGLDAARVIDELFRVSAGDPLVLQLLLDELGRSKATVDLERLKRMQPGLAGYMDRWWQEQKALWGDQAPQFRQEVGTLLDLLAMALAPLPDEDLLALAPRELPSHHVLGAALQLLVRLVIGDGQRGRVFTHPALTEYFRGHLPAAHRAEIEARFVARGRKVIEELDKGQWSPREAPRYVITTHRTHLERTKAGADAFLALVSDGWRAAREAAEGTLAGFLADVRAAWQELSVVQAKEARAGRMPRRWAEEVRCALVQASIGSLNAHIPERLLELLLDEGRWTPGQALIHAEQCPDSLDRPKLLVVVFARLPDELLDEALEVACETAREPGGFEALQVLIPRLAVRQPEMLMARFDCHPWALSGLLEIAQHCTGAQRDAVLREVLGRVRRIEDPGKRSRSLMYVAEKHTGEQQGELAAEAWEIACRIPQATERFHVIERLLKLVPDALRERVARSAIEAVLAMHAESSHDGEGRAAGMVGHLRLLKLPPRLAQEARKAVWRLVQEMPPVQRIQALLQLAKWLDGNERREVLLELLEILPHLADQEQRALRLREVLQLDPALLPSVLAEVARLTKPGLGEAVRVGLARYLPAEQQRALWPLAARRGESWRTEQLEILLQFPVVEWAERLREMDVPAARTHLILTALRAEELDEATWVELAQEACRELHLLSPDQRAKALWELFRLSLHEPLLDAFLGAVKDVEDPYERTSLLESVWSSLHSPYQERVLEQAIDAARSLSQPRMRANSLARIAQRLSQDSEQAAASLWREVLAGWSELNVQQLVEVAECTRGELRKDALEKALRARRRFRDEFSYLQMLGALAPHLPEPVLLKMMIVCSCAQVPWKGSMRGPGGLA